jgi:hypothetical protein
VNTYESGSLVRTTCVFTNISGTPTNPSTVTLKYRSGAGSTTTVTPANDSAGAYHYDLDTTGWTGPDAQLWVYEYTGTGTVQAIKSGAFEVTAPAL